MAITITNLESPSNCGHVTITANVDGQSRSTHVHVDDVLEIIKASGLDYRVVMTMCAIKYWREQGDGWPAIIGRTVIS